MLEKIHIKRWPIVIYIENNSVNPYFNLACEEYCLENLDFNDDIIILWRNDNSVIIGKNQNAFEEINSDFVKAHGIKVARRLTGGGAVYHDLGNLNYSFILKIDRAETLDYKAFAVPVVKALEKMGITAEISGRNDIIIEGKKISGTAQYICKNKLLYHGTLIFDSDMNVLSNALNVRSDKIQSKSLKSVKSRVTNIKGYLKQDIDILDFKKLILKYLFEGKEFKEYSLTKHDIECICKLEREKFATWEWNYGASPKCNFKNYMRFGGGGIEINLNIKGGLIEYCKIYGDFLAVKSLDEFEAGLVGQRYIKEDISSFLAGMDIAPMFGTITKEEILACIFP